MSRKFMTTFRIHVFIEIVFPITCFNYYFHIKLNSVVQYKAIKKKQIIFLLQNHWEFASSRTKVAGGEETSGDLTFPI